MSAVDLLPKCKEIKIEVLRRYGRTLESLKQDVESMKEWTKKQPHFPEVPSDIRIELFLFASKFRFAKAKKMMDMYYTSKGVIPEFFKDPEAPEVLAAMELLYWIPLPKVVSTDCRVIVCKLRQRSEAHQFDAEAACSFIAHLIEILVLQDVASIKIFLIDASNVQMEHVAAFSPLLLKKALYIIEEVYSSRVLQMHFINVPSVMEPAIALGKSLMKAKLAERIHFHKNMESVFEYIPKEAIPSDYGGEEESLETLYKLWREKIKYYIPMLRKQCSLKTDESKRPEECAFNSELLGLEGNFRKLNVD